MGNRKEIDNRLQKTLEDIDNSVGDPETKEKAKVEEKAKADHERQLLKAEMAAEPFQNAELARQVVLDKFEQESGTDVIARRIAAERAVQTEAAKIEVLEKGLGKLLKLLAFFFIP